MINDYLKKVGGTETFIYNLKSSLEKRGHKVCVYGSERGEDLASLFSRWNSQKWYRKVAKKIEEFHPDIIHVHNCTRILSPSVVTAALDMKIPVILTLHDFLYFPKKNNSFRNIIGGAKRAMHRKILSDKRIIFVSPTKILAKDIEKYLNVKVAVIPNGITIPKKITNYKKQILFVGSLTEGKGLQVVAPILNRINNYNVIILGVGPLKKELISKFKNIDFKGFQNPKEYYENSSILIFPSIILDNFPTSIIEAMSYGLTVIASKIGGVPEQIEDSKTGILVEPNNIEEFEKKLNYLISNPGEIKRIGGNARKFVKQKFEWGKIIDLYEKKYFSAINLSGI